MRTTSIQTKLLAMCILLALLATAGISATYYVLTKQDKHRESQQRIKIAFGIIFDDSTSRLADYTNKFDEFLQLDTALGWIAKWYNEDSSQLGSIQFITSYVIRAAEELKKFGYIAAMDQVTLYAADKRLLLVYQGNEERDTVGEYVISETGNDTYLSMDDFSQLSAMLHEKQAIPDAPLPPDIAPYFEGEIPDTISAGLFSEGQKLGLRVLAPIYLNEQKTGVLVGKVFYTRSMVDRYVALSETAINFFAENQLSVGTLDTQAQLDSETMAQMIPCEEILNAQAEVAISSVTFVEQDYYQGQCAFKDPQQTIGAITVSLSQEIEKQEIAKILTSVLIISGIVIGVAFALSVIFSRKTIRSIHNIVSIIDSASEGDLRKTATAMTHDEIGRLAVKLNQMIAQLRTISGQVQGAAHAINATADIILQQMETLIQYMEQQSASVDNTTESLEKIKQFIDMVAQNTNELLSAASHILSSIQETRASIEEITVSTGSLMTNLQLINSSIDQVNQAVKRISENTGHLNKVAQQTETEVHHIDQSLKDVTHNAEQTQQFAKETMEAALSGQGSVETSLRSMTELKEVVSNTAQIIQEASAWGEQVSAILDIVDDITEQTSLLALNASIISAQAGGHGRGFAVVANEIKELATRTKTSTKEIGTLIHELQKKTEDGVNNTVEGLKKADQGMQLATAVKEALTTILNSATRSSNRAADTVQVIQQTTASSQNIRTSMKSVTEMASTIKTAIQEQEGEIEQVVSAVENISGMAEQVNRASIEQKKAAGEVERNMAYVTEKFSDISEQTKTLTTDFNQIVKAMHTIESATEQILRDAATLSGETVKNLVQQSDVLRKLINVFRVE